MAWALNGARLTTLVNEKRIEDFKKVLKDNPKLLYEPISEQFFTLTPVDYVAAYGGSDMLQALIEVDPSQLIKSESLRHLLEDGEKWVARADSDVKKNGGKPDMRSFKTQKRNTRNI